MYRSQQRWLLLIALFAFTVAAVVWQARKLATGMHAQREMGQLVLQVQRVTGESLLQQRLCKKEAECAQRFQVQAKRLECTMEHCNIQLQMRVPPELDEQQLRQDIDSIIRCQHVPSLRFMRKAQGQTGYALDGCFTHLRISSRWH